jgi:DNA-binding XRE family transcriptional regulator
MVFYKVRSVEPLGGLKLIVTFQNGIEKEYNVNPLLRKWEACEVLKSVRGLFEMVKVASGGYGIYWNNDIDLSCNELWENGKTLTWEMQFRADLTEKLRELRKRGRITQTKLAEMAGFRQESIARIEKMSALPKTETLLKILNPLGYTLGIIPAVKSQKCTKD